MGPSYLFFQFGPLALAAQFEFSMEIPMPAQASLASWPISAHYSFFPLPAQKPCTGLAGLPACAAFQPSSGASSTSRRPSHHLLWPVPPCHAPSTATLLRAHRAKPKHHRAAFTPPLKWRCPVSSSPLTPSKSMGIKTPPPLAASPPPYHLPSPIKAPHPRPTPPRSSSLPSLHLLSPSASDTEHSCRALLCTAAGPPRRPSTRGEPTTRVSAPPSFLPCLRGKPPCPRAAARPSSGELWPLTTVRSTVDPWTGHPHTVYPPWTQSTIFIFKNKSKSNKSRTLTPSP
jgi:hypothetical protein